LAAAGSESQLCALSEYGLNLGMAFQITDDLLDIIGDEASEGKTLGTDFAKRKPTLPIIHLLNATDPQQKYRPDGKTFHRPHTRATGPSTRKLRQCGIHPGHQQEILPKGDRIAKTPPKQPHHRCTYRSRRLYKSKVRLNLPAAKTTPNSA